MDFCNNIVKKIAKGGQIVKIKNRTTKIKLELTPSNDIDIDKAKSIITKIEELSKEIRTPAGENEIEKKQEELKNKKQNRVKTRLT